MIHFQSSKTNSIIYESPFLSSYPYTHSLASMLISLNYAIFWLAYMLTHEFADRIINMNSSIVVTMVVFYCAWIWLQLTEPDKSNLMKANRRIFAEPTLNGTEWQRCSQNSFCTAKWATHPCKNCCLDCKKRLLCYQQIPFNQRFEWVCDCDCGNNHRSVYAPNSIGSRIPCTRPIIECDLFGLY